MWRVEDYKQALDRIPSLKDLVKNPFLMTLSLDVLPRMVDPGQHLSAARVTRVALYDHFVEQWLERGKKRLGEKDMNPQTKSVFERLSAGGFTRSGIEYLKRLSVAIYKKQGGNPVVEYSPLIDEGSWKDEFFKKDQKQLLLEASPLTRNGNQHRFIHRSLLEYGLARAVFDPQDRRNRGASEPTVTRRGSTSSTLSFEITDVLDKESGAIDQMPDLESPLVWRNFVNDHSLLHFLEERVRQEPVLVKQLFAYIEHSKLDKKWRTAAANAITILVRSGIQFNGLDLNGIQIPGADLSNGVFGSVQLRGADLRKVNLRGIWMAHADLSGAQMEGVQFGELPYLPEDDNVISCTFSPNGKSFAVGLASSKISVYTTSNWEKAMTLVGHLDKVACVVYSPEGDRIVSASWDYSARLWDAVSGECRHIIIHTSRIRCVAYSPQGGQLAIGGCDGALRLRDSISGELIQILSGHTGDICRAAYSPRGDKIATGAVDCTVRLWNIETGICSHIMIGHSYGILGLVFSPRSDHIASSGIGRAIRLWDLETGRCCKTLDVKNSVLCTAYSPKGDQIVSSKFDNEVQIWDVESGTNLQTFTGHRDLIWTVVYSPQGNLIASGSSDNTVRLWDNSVNVSRFVTTHPNETLYIACSPTGNQFASYNWGSAIRILDIGTGVCRRTLTCHSGIGKVIYSPQGDRILSWEYAGPLLLWNVELGTSQHLVNVTFSLGLPCFAFSTDGGTVASSSPDKNVQLWDVVSGDCLAILIGHADSITSVVFSPSGKVVASGSSDGVIRLWDVDIFACQHTLNCRTEITNLAFSPQGNQLAISGTDLGVLLWDMDSEDFPMILIGHKSRYSSIVITYSPSGDTLISASGSTIRFWDIASGQCRSTIPTVGDDVQDFIHRRAHGEIYVVTGSFLKTPGLWRIIDEADQCYLISRCIVTNGELEVTGTTIQDARGLSSLNKQLLKQRGAVGEPEFLFYEASKKVVAMASALSKFGQPMDGNREQHQTPPITELVDGQAESNVEQPDDAQ